MDISGISSVDKVPRARIESTSDVFTGHIHELSVLAHRCASTIPPSKSKKHSCLPATRKHSDIENTFCQLILANRCQDRSGNVFA